MSIQEQSLERLITNFASSTIKDLGENSWGEHLFLIRSPTKFSDQSIDFKVKFSKKQGMVKGYCSKFPEDEQSDQDSVLARERLVSLLDDNALEALTNFSDQLGNSSVDAYNWLCGYSLNKFKPRAKFEQIKHRIQASTIYPMLPYLINHSSLNNDQKAQVLQLEQAIDQKEPIANLLAQMLGVSSAMARRLSGLKIEDFYPSEFNRIRLADERSPIEILSKLRWVEPDHMPKSIQNWNALQNASKLVESYFGQYDQENMICIKSNLIGSCLKGIAGKWSKVKSKEVEAAGLRDVVGDFQTQVIRPILGFVAIGDQAISTYKSEEIAKVMFSQDKTYSNLLATSKWWHAHYQRIRSDLRTQYPLNSDQAPWHWLKLCDNFSASNGWTVSSLTNADDLFEEHRLLHHCVDQYVNACMYKGQHILSICNQNGEHMSTLQIDEKRLKTAMQEEDHPFNAVMQHRAAYNGEPCQQAQAAVDEWLEAIRNLELKINPDLSIGLKERLEVRREIESREPFKSLRENLWGELPVYNPYEREGINKAWNSYLPLLSSKFKELSLEQVVAFALEISHFDWNPENGIDEVLERIQHDDWLTNYKNRISYSDSNIESEDSDQEGVATPSL